MSKSNFVDFRAVKREVTMVQVLEHYGLMSRMQQSGQYIIGPCPIHEGGNDTAFCANLRTNCWNCSDVGWNGGNVLNFVAGKEKVSVLKAANLLAAWFNLRVGPLENDDE